MKAKKRHGQNLSGDNSSNKNQVKTKRDVYDIKYLLYKKVLWPMDLTF